MSKNGSGCMPIMAFAAGCMLFGRWACSTSAEDDRKSDMKSAMAFAKSVRGTWDKAKERVNDNVGKAEANKEKLKRSAKRVREQAGETRDNIDEMRLDIKRALQEGGGDAMHTSSSTTMIVVKPGMLIDPRSRTVYRFDPDDEKPGSENCQPVLIERE